MGKSVHEIPNGLERPVYIRVTPEIRADFLIKLRVQYDSMKDPKSREAFGEIARRLQKLTDRQFANFMHWRNATIASLENRGGQDGTITL